MRLSEILFSKKDSSEKEIFGSYEHDGTVPLSSQLGEGLENIESKMVHEPVNHSVDTKSRLAKYAIILCKIFKAVLSKKTKEMLTKIKKEKAITEADEAIDYAREFVYKFGYGENMPEEEKRTR